MAPLFKHCKWRLVSSKHLKAPKRNILTSSQVEGPKRPPLDSRTLTSYFESELLAKFASKPALICPKERPRAHAGPQLNNLGRKDCLAWSFEDFNCHINALARGLNSLGVSKGDRVGVVMGNNSAYASLQWACASIGAILVTINPAYRVHELIGTLKHVGVSTLVLVPRIRSSYYLNALADTIPALATSEPGKISVEELPELRNIAVVDNALESGDFSKLLDSIKCAIDFRDVFVWDEGAKEKRTIVEIRKTLTDNDIINLQFTSGTTGLPKAVSLTHRNLLNNGIFIGRCMRLTSEDVLFYPSEIFDPPSIVDAIVQEKCTALHGVPTHFLGVLAEVDKRTSAGEALDMRRLRTGIAAGSPIPIELMQRLISRLNLVDLTIAYGMTETSPVSFQTTPDDPIIKRTETVGKVQAHVKAKLINPEGNVVPVGAPGEICVSGYLIQKGYWKDDEQTKSVMRKHDDDPDTIWMHTGDIGIMDEEGYLRVIGRIKDIIIRGGENLFPVQIENRLTFHPSIREAAVIAVSDDKYGEVVGAWIVHKEGTKQTREEIRGWVAEGMNPQNAPAWIWFVGEDGAPSALPKTASGKVQKHVLREWAKDLVARRVGRIGSS